MLRRVFLGLLAMTALPASVFAKKPNTLTPTGYTITRFARQRGVYVSCERVLSTGKSGTYFVYILSISEALRQQEPVGSVWHNQNCLVHEDGYKAFYAAMDAETPAPKYRSNKSICKAFVKAFESIGYAVPVAITRMANQSDPSTARQKDEHA